VEQRIGPRWEGLYTVQPPPWRPDTDELAFGGGEGQRPLQLGMQGWREMQERAKEENGF
jgi:hypothetical protein